MLAVAVLVVVYLLLLTVKGAQEVAVILEVLNPRPAHTRLLLALQILVAAVAAQTTIRGRVRQAAPVS